MVTCYMDVEKTIQFLLSNQAAADARQAAADARLTRLEAFAASNAEGIRDLTQTVKQLDTVLDSLSQSMIAINEQAAERDRRLGERIERLVSGIGEFMRLPNLRPELGFPPA